MMLKNTVSDNRVLYAFINTLYKLTTTSRINFSRTHNFESLFKVFQSNENFENFVSGEGFWRFTNPKPKIPNLKIPKSKIPKLKIPKPKIPKLKIPKSKIPKNIYFYHCCFYCCYKYH